MKYLYKLFFILSFNLFEMKSLGGVYSVLGGIITGGASYLLINHINKKKIMEFAKQSDSNKIKINDWITGKNTTAFDQLISYTTGVDKETEEISNEVGLIKKSWLISCALGIATTVILYLISK